VNHSVSAEPAISSNELEFSSQELFELDADPLANDTEDEPNIEHLPDTGRITSGLIKDVRAELGSKLDKLKVPSTTSNKFVTQQKKNKPPLLSKQCRAFSGLILTQVYQDWEMDEKVFDSDDAFTSTSVTAQKLSFDDANKPAKDLLLSPYPDLRVFMNSDGSSELNDMRLSIWASHITRRTKGVDKDHPSVSQWFNFKDVIKPVKTNTINPVANTFERVDGTFMPQQMGPLPPYFFPPHFHPNAPPSQSFYTHGPAAHGYYTHGALLMFASSYQPALSGYGFIEGNWQK
ncbi:hypothetical protein F5879DRAFT_928026, partial [Lentinula edodes]